MAMESKSAPTTHMLSTVYSCLSLQHYMEIFICNIKVNHLQSGQHPEAGSRGGNLTEELWLAALPDNPGSFPNIHQVLQSVQLSM